MKKVMNRIWEKKNSKKGFTLVELIVVLVILAILAAIMVPALTGWIGKAKEKQAAVNARTVYLAAQTVASETYAGLSGTDTVASVMGLTNGVLTVDSETATDAAKQIVDLAKVTEAYIATIYVSADGEVTTLEYEPKDGNIKPITIGADVSTSGGAEESSASNG